MGVIVQPAPNTAAYPLAVDSADALKPWTMGAAGQDALNRTNLAYQDYLHAAFASWLVNYQAFRASEPPPPPPPGFNAQMTDDGLGWDLIPSGVPSGPIPNYQKRPEPSASPTAPGVNPFSVMGSRSLLVAQIGGRATQADGTVWIRIS